MTKYLLPLFVLVIFLTPSEAGATRYYIDFNCVANTDTACGNGLSTTTPFSGIDEFTDAARSAGDIAYIRRGQASTTNITDVVFTSDGTLNNPISLTADYDKLWPDSFATSTPTATVTFGSKFVALSASSTQLQTPNKWVYFEGDCAENPASTTLSRVNPCEYMYEVASTSPAGLDLYLPYKGTLSGSGINMRIASSAPQWNTTAGDFQFVMSTDTGWIFKGIDIRSTDSAGAFTTANPQSTILYDVIIQTDATTAAYIGGATPEVSFTKSRFFGSGSTNGTGNVGGIYKNVLIDCNNTANTTAVGSPTATYGLFVVLDSTIQNCPRDVTLSNSNSQNYIFRNVTRPQTYFLSVGSMTVMNFEDDFSTLGLNSTVWKGISSATIATTTVSTSTELRSGGGPKNILVTPPTGSGATGISTLNYPASYIKLFEYPIYTDTSSKTYSMYFMATSSTAFNSAPFTSTQTGSSTPELYIECEYYNETSGADRFLKRSNTASAFAADGTWDPISVTCQPTQAGILYLRGWYAKPNDGRSNRFFMDTTPVIQ